MDFPVYTRPAPPVLTPSSLGSLGTVSSVVANNQNLWGTASATWLTANTAFFYPFEMTDWGTAYQLLFWVGATSSGNLDVGIYDSQGNRIVSAGSTAMSATVNTVQELNITDTVIAPGSYFLAAAVDNTTGTVFRSANADEQSIGMDIYEITGLTAAALPATATPVVTTASVPPVVAVGIQFRSVF